MLKCERTSVDKLKISMPDKIKEGRKTLVKLTYVHKIVEILTGVIVFSVDCELGQITARVYIPATHRSMDLYF